MEMNNIYNNESDNMVNNMENNMENNKNRNMENMKNSEKMCRGKAPICASQKMVRKAM